MHLHRQAHCRSITTRRGAIFEALERRDLLSADVLSYRYGPADQGQNANETVLTPANVNAADFGKLSSTPLDGQVYAQPLYMENVNITTGPSPGLHNVVFVATMHDSVFAIDADSGSVLWQTSFIDPSAGITTASSADVSETDISPEIGILSTPVINSSTNTLYVEALTKEIIGGQTHFIHRLHAIDLGDGSEKLGGPDVLGDTVLNSDGSFDYVSGPAVDGDGPDSVNGVETFNAKIQLQRAALSLINGVVYVAFASYGDNFNYHGWVLGVDSQSMNTVAAFNDTPNGTQGGIWQSGGSISSDTSGNLYLSTGNGTFDTTLDGNGFPAQQDYGDAILKLVVDPASSPINQNGNGWGLKVVDYFTPYNTQQLNSQDSDLGSSGPVLLPDSAGSAADPHLLLTGGKDGTIFLLDRDNLGKFNPQADQIVQGEFGVIDSEYGPPGYFNGSFYFTGIDVDLKSFSLSNAAFSDPTATSPDDYSFPGAISSISSNGNAGGIIWQVEHDTSELRAYDATNVTDELYTSSQAPGGRDQLDGGAIKFSVPTVADGQVFVGTADSLVIYGLLNSPPPPTVQFGAASQSINQIAGTFRITLNLSVASGVDTTVPFTLGGTAISGVDYSGVTTSPLVISAGQTSGAISGTLLDDRRSSTPNNTITFALGTPTNATLGAITADTLTINETTPTPISFLTPDQKYVGAVFESVLHREVDTGALAYWSAQLDQGVSAGLFASAVTHSDEYYGDLIQSAYQRFLGRAGDSEGLQAWIQAMQAGLTDEQLEAAFVSSPEFYARSGGTNLAWVDAVYDELLGRAADTAGEQAWVQAQTQGESREAIAYDFAASPEREQIRVQGDYQQFLGRNASNAEVASWVDAFERGMTNENVITSFVASDEYFNEHS